MIDFRKIEDDSNVELINDLRIKEKVEKNTKYFSFSKSYDDKYLEAYQRTKNDEAEKIKAEKIKEDYCFVVFCKFFEIYKSRNLNIEYNRIQSRIKFLKNENNKRLRDVVFHNSDRENLLNLFNILKKIK